MNKAIKNSIKNARKVEKNNKKSPRKVTKNEIIKQREKDWHKSFSMSKK